MSVQTQTRCSRAHWGTLHTEKLALGAIPLGNLNSVIDAGLVATVGGGTSPPTPEGKARCREVSGLSCFWVACSTASSVVWAAHMTVTWVVAGVAFVWAWLSAFLSVESGQWRVDQRVAGSLVCTIGAAVLLAVVGVFLFGAYSAWQSLP